VIELYLAKPSTVRKWASERGIRVNERGRIPSEVIEQYLARPSAVRSWARKQGIDIGERGRIPLEVVDRYLDRFRQLDWDAA
jgi:Lsr2